MTVNIPPFLQGLSSNEIAEIQHVSIKYLPLIHRISNLVHANPARWSEAINLCFLYEKGYQLLLGAVLLNKLNELDAATAYLFLDSVLSLYDKSHDVTFLEEPQIVEVQEAYGDLFGDLSDIPENHRYVIPNIEMSHVYFGKAPPMIQALGFSLSQIRKTHPNPFTIQPCFGISTRREMIASLREMKSLVGLPLPGKKQFIHGQDVGVAWSVVHDLGHLIQRCALIEAIGPQRFTVLLDHASFFEDIQDQLPPYSKELSSDTIEPLLSPDATLEDQMRYLIFLSSGQIIDGDTEFTFTFDEINEQSIRFLVEEALYFIRTKPQIFNHPAFFKPEMFSSTIVEKTVELIERFRPVRSVPYCPSRDAKRAE